MLWCATALHFRKEALSPAATPAAAGATATARPGTSGQRAGVVAPRPAWSDPGGPRTAAEYPAEAFLFGNLLEVAAIGLQGSAALGAAPRQLSSGRQPFSSIVQPVSSMRKFAKRPARSLRVDLRSEAALMSAGLRARATAAFVDAAGWLLARVPPSAFGTDPSADDADDKAAEKDRQLGGSGALTASYGAAPPLPSFPHALRHLSDSPQSLSREGALSLALLTRSRIAGPAPEGLVAQLGGIAEASLLSELIEARIPPRARLPAAPLKLLKSQKNCASPQGSAQQHPSAGVPQARAAGGAGASTSGTILTTAALSHLLQRALIATSGAARGRLLSSLAFHKSNIIRRLWARPCQTPRPHGAPLTRALHLAAPESIATSCVHRHCCAHSSRLEAGGFFLSHVALCLASNPSGGCESIREGRTMARLLRSPGPNLGRSTRGPLPGSQLRARHV